MAKIQKQFFDFHSKIKLDIEDKALLIEKKNKIKQAIKDHIRKINEENGYDPPIEVSFFDQGSYAMHTGVYPLKDEEDYDIDMGVMFNVGKKDVNAMTVKQWIFDAVYCPPFRIPMHRKPCVRVQYIENGLPKFHVDIATYSDAECNNDGLYYLARGLPNSKEEDKKWEVAEPYKLKRLINNWSDDGDDRHQFRRAIRDLKRWKDNKFLCGNGRPTGIALTALANEGFKCCFEKDSFTGSCSPNDAQALLDFVNYILGKFSIWTGRITVKLPVPPYNDLFEKMTDTQCANFKDKLERLRDALDFAINSTTDPHEACKRLEKEFGDDFPIPTKEETARYSRPAMVGSMESA